VILDKSYVWFLGALQPFQALEYTFSVHVGHNDQA